MTAKNVWPEHTEPDPKSPKDQMTLRSFGLLVILGLAQYVQADESEFAYEGGAVGVMDSCVLRNGEEAFLEKSSFALEFLEGVS